MVEGGGSGGGERHNSAHNAAAAEVTPRGSHRQTFPWASTDHNQDPHQGSQKPQEAAMLRLGGTWLWRVRRKRQGPSGWDQCKGRGALRTYPHGGRSPSAPKV